MAYSLRTYLPFYRRNLKVALPIVFSQLGGALVQLVDTLMVGRLGTVQLASVSFATSVFIIGFVFSIGILMGLTPLVGMAYVRGDHARVTDLFQNSLTLATLSAVVMCSLLFGVIHLMPYMGQDAAVVETAIPYFKTLVFSLIPFLYFTAIKQFFEGMGNTMIAMVITIISNLINVLFNYLLIYGKFGFPELGVLGAGVSTLISRLTMPLMFLLAIRLRSEWWAYFRAFRMHLFSWRRLFELVKVGAPIAAHMLLEVLAFALSAIMVGWLGATPQAGHQIAQNMSHLTYMIVLGIGAATTVRVSHQLGALDLDAARKAGNASVHLCLVYNTLAGTLLITFRHAIASAFTSDPAVIDIGGRLIIMAGIFQVSDGLQTIGAGILRGLTDVKIVMLYAFIAYICINLPFGYLLGFVFQFGAIGVWAGFIFGLSVAAVLFRLRCRKMFRQLAASGKYAVKTA